MQISRRHFIIVVASLASASVLQTESHAAAQEVSESDPTAQPLGYKSDGATVDTAKYPKYHAGYQLSALSGQVRRYVWILHGVCWQTGQRQGLCSAYVKKA